MIELVSSVIGPIDQDTANANGAHFSEGGDRLGHRAMPETGRLGEKKWVAQSFGKRQIFLQIFRSVDLR
jgi:hypothetical protein